MNNWPQNDERTAPKIVSSKIYDFEFMIIGMKGRDSRLKVLVLHVVYAGLYQRMKVPTWFVPQSRTQAQPSHSQS